MRETATTFWYTGLAFSILAGINVHVGSYGLATAFGIVAIGQFTRSAALEVRR